MAYEFKDFYAILDIERGASAEQIKKAFHKLAKQYHPDVNPGNADAEVKFKQINEAYSILSDDLQRRTYDATNYAAGRAYRAEDDAERGAHSSRFRRAANRAYVRREARPAGAGGAESKQQQQYQSKTAGEAYDFDEWNNMHYGPGAEGKTGAQRKDYNSSQQQFWKQAGQGGGASFQGFQGGSPYGAGPSSSASQRAFAERGASETQFYRAYAKSFRAAEAKSTWPKATVAFAGALALIYVFTRPRAGARV